MHTILLKVTKANERVSLCEANELVTLERRGDDYKLNLTGPICQVLVQWLSLRTLATAIRVNAG